MPLDNTQYEMIMREYDRRQNENRRRLILRQQEIYQKIPEYSKTEDEISSIGASAVRAAVVGKRDGTKELKDRLSALFEKKRQLLLDHGYPGDYLEPVYSCPVCQDTGFVNGNKCRCFQKTLTDLLYSQSNLREILKQENFSSFSLAFYSDTAVDPISGMTHRALAKKAFDLSREFTARFDTQSENLFFYGDTGVGKTFLSHCIAGDLLLSGHSVLYYSSYELFEALADEAFDRKEGQNGQSVLDPFLMCDLLIIDDLGAERTNSFVASELFLLVNERLLRRKSTVISTNLTFRDFSAVYTERTFSRITSSYAMARLVGSDIRIQKKLSGGHA